MPGTIQVSVLEFQSSSSSSSPSTMSLKVSIGKKDYQTSDKGDFFFPLTTLRDNLVVALQDADGNKIAQTGVRTMSIVEKGSWDDIFAFEGGGHVHMKLQFILSEGDRIRIRTMRESAMKKKIAMKNSANLTERSLNEKASAVQTGPVVDDPVQAMKKEESLYRQALPNATDTSEGASPAPKLYRTEVLLTLGNQMDPVKMLESPLPRTDNQSKPLSGQEGSSKQVDFVNKSERRRPIEKTPSSVKKMISAFEITPDQDPGSTKKAQDNNVKKAGRFKDVITPAETNSVGFENPMSLLLESPPESIGSDQDFLVNESSPAPPQSICSNKDFVARERSPAPPHRIGSDKDFVVTNEPSPGPRESIGSTKDFVENEPSPAKKKTMDLSTTITESEGIEVSTENIFSEESREEEVKMPQDMIIPSTTETTRSPKKKLQEDSKISMINPSISEKHEENLESNTMTPSIAQKHEEVSMTSDKLEEISNINTMIPLIGENYEEDSEISTMIPSISEKDEEDLETNTQVVSNERSNSVPSYNEEEHNTFGNLDMLISPNNTGNICITTASEDAISLLEETEAKSHSESESTKRVSISHGERKNDRNFFYNLRKTISGSSPDDAPNGLFGQVLKIAIVVGFGVLVLLTRQRETRKNSKKEAKGRFFITQDYMDE